MKRGLSTGRGVTIYLIGFFLTNVGVGGFTLAIGLALYRQTGSADTFALLVGVEYALGLAGQLLGGSILDRRDVLTVGLVSNSIRGVAVLVGGALFLASDSQLVLVSAFLVSAFIRPLYRAASFVMVRQVADVAVMPQVNTLRFGLLQVAQLAGLGVVSGLFVVLPSGAVLCAVAVFFLSGTAVHFLLRGIPDRSAAQGAGEPKSPAPMTLRENWRQLGQVLRSNPGLCVHLVIGVMPSVITSLASVLVAPVNQALRGGPLGITVLDGGASVGALLTVLVVRRIDARRPYLVGVACATAVLALGLLAGASALPVAGLAFLGIGVATTLGATTSDTILQLRSAPQLLGRLSITRESATSITAIAMIPLTGPVTTDWGVHVTALVFTGVAAAYLSLFLVTAAVLRGRFFGQRAELRPDRASTDRLEASV
ncbi:MFS transporter [Kitasatospora sp. NPDC001175]|uniref:MFS transporter n=1 Tax=Kitasatospora sp. NPDC001175 TaxID=3157103 RepID=UPI003CFBF382